MGVTLGQAAKLASVSKSTLTRAIKSGRLSAQRRDDGGYEIDVAELARVYDVRIETPATGGATGGVTQDATAPAQPRDADATPDVTARLAALDAEVRGLRELLAEVRDSRDQWRQQAERLAITGPGERRGFWRRLVG